MSSSLVKSILTLATGSIASSAVMALSIPVLTRVYSPEEFGVFGVYLSIVGLIALVSSAKLESALMLTSFRFDRALILKTCVFLVCIITCLILILLLLFNSAVKNYLGTESIIPVLLIIPGVLVLCAHKFMTINANSNREYTQVSKGAFYRSIVVVICQLVLGYFLSGMNGLIFGSILSYLFYCVYFLNSTDFLKDYNSKKITVIKSRYTLKKFERTYLYLFPQSILNYISQQLPFLIFPFFYSTSVLGGLFVAQRLLKMPAGILTMAIRNVFYPYFRDKSQNGLFLPYIKLTLGLFLFGLPITILLYFYITDLVVFVLGEEWYEAGKYSKYLIFWVFMSIVNVATTPALTIISDNKLLLNYEITDFLIKAFFILYCLNVSISAIDSVFYYSFMCSVSYVVICCVCAYRLLLNNKKIGLKI